MKTAFLFAQLLVLGCSASGQVDEETDVLIEGLVIAPSREVFQALEPTEWTVRYDRSRKALDQLLALELRAFPRLVAHIDDQRTAIALKVRHLPPLGETCFDILESQVCPGEIPSCLFSYSFLDIGLMREWWKERSGLPLRDLQVEAALFALALARHDNDKCATSLAERVEELGVADPESAMEPFRKAFAGLALPEAQDDLIATFQLPPGNYLQRRIALRRSGGAGYKLVKMGLSAFPALLRHLDDPATGDRCFEVIQQALLDAYYDDDHPEFTLLSKASVASWLKERSGRTLKELRIEIVHHWIDTATRTSYKDKEEKKRLLEFLDEQLDRIQKE